MRNLITYGLILSAAATTNALASVDDKDVAKCAAVENSVQRLSCYDTLADDHDLSKKTVATPIEGKGKWSTSTKTDPLNDQSIYVAALVAESGQGRFGEQIVMIVRCNKNTTDLYINWESFLGTEEAIVTHRVGKEKAVRQAWTVSTDHQSSFYPVSPVSVLKKMATADSFVVSVTPYSESPVTATFDISGAENALTDIRKGCKW